MRNPSNRAKASSKNVWRGRQTYKYLVNNRTSSGRKLWTPSSNFPSWKPRAKYIIVTWSCEEAKEFCGWIVWNAKVCCYRYSAKSPGCLRSRPINETNFQIEKPATTTARQIEPQMNLHHHAPGVPASHSIIRKTCEDFPRPPSWIPSGSRDVGSWGISRHDVTWVPVDAAWVLPLWAHSGRHSCTNGPKLR